MGKRGGVAVDVRVDETLHLEVLDILNNGKTERIAITVEHKSGGVARMRVNASRNVRITPPRLVREEVASPG